MGKDSKKSDHNPPLWVGGKIILLIRHAKSSWTNVSLNDFDRPLNERGKTDAPMMAHRLHDNKVKIDAFISSPAKRASSTAKIFAKEYKIKKEGIIYTTELYGAGERDFFDVIENISNKYDSIALISHNPGLTDFANTLAEARIDNIPTCGVFAVRTDAKMWADFEDAHKKFWFFDYPKAVIGEKK